MNQQVILNIKVKKMFLKQNPYSTQLKKSWLKNVKENRNLEEDVANF
jgi:hypothetical protein